jgi:hypothetical protein
MDEVAVVRIEHEVGTTDDMIPDSPPGEVGPLTEHRKTPQRSPSTASPSLTPIGSTPARDPTPIPTRPAGVYKDRVPSNATFWVEINPKPSLDRDLYQTNQEEFRVAAVYDEFGEGDDLSYEVQFEDDQIATVRLKPHISVFKASNTSLAAFDQAPLLSRWGYRA